MKWLLIVAAASLSSAQVTPDPRLRANKNTYSPVMEVLQARHGRATDEQLERLGKMPVEAVWASLQRLGYVNSHVSGMHTTRPGERLVGRALTMRYLPRRPDLVAAMEGLAKEGDWSPAYNVRAGEESKPGDVVVVDLGGGIPDGIFWGDISATAARAAGARGAVLYGSTRDYSELKEMAGFPVLAMGFDPRPATQIGVDWNVPIRVAGATVIPNDVVFADDEAVFFFPPSILPQVLEQCQRIVDQEDYERTLTRERRYRFRDVYPLNPELRRQYEEQRKKQ
ncbi:MAG TPA: hypothetical protein VFA33_22665 [Bryobacteraceae bacterium]|nr:hypothetical protein [Bryobacteraceae bacterium]